MIFLIISIPLSLLCAYLAWLAFRIDHNRTAAGLTIVALVSTLFSASVIGGFHFIISQLNIK